MRKFVSLMIVLYMGAIILSCDRNDGCYIFNPGGTLEDVVKTDDGFFQILMMCPVEDIIFENARDSSQAQIYLNKAHRIQNDVYGPYMAKLFKMSLKDRYELLAVLDSIYRERMLEERLWHIKRINGLNEETSIDYEWR